MLEIGSLIDGKYKILNEVGHGGMSVVYLAMNERANKQWAIKEVRKDGVKDFEVVKQSLVAETNMLKKLSHMLHRNSLVEWGRQTREQIYIVWEPQCIILLRE